VADKTRGMFHFPDPLAVSTAFDIFVLSVSSREQGTLIGGSIRIENPDILQQVAALHGSTMS